MAKLVLGAEGVGAGVGVVEDEVAEDVEGAAGGGFETGGVELLAWGVESTAPARDADLLALSRPRRANPAVAR